MTGVPCAQVTIPVRYSIQRTTPPPVRMRVEKRTGPNVSSDRLTMNSTIGRSSGWNRLMTAS